MVATIAERVQNMRQLIRVLILVVWSNFSSWAVAQVPEPSEDGSQVQGARADRAPKPEESPTELGLPTGKSKSKGVLRIDGDQITYIGTAEDAKNFEKVLEKLEDEAKKSQVAVPDIRRYKCRHIDVSLAAQLLDDIYNGPQKARQRVQQVAAQNQRGRQQPPQQPGQQPRGRQQPEPEPEPEAEVDGGLGGIFAALLGKGSAAAGAAEDLMGIQVTPDKRSGHLFIMAKTELFPFVIETLHTIDVVAVQERDYELVPLKRLSADEVQVALEDVLGITEARQRRTVPQAAQANRARRAGQPQGQDAAALAEQLQDELLQIGEGGTGFSLKDIRISSLPATNTIIVFGPKEARETIVKLIGGLDKEGPEERVVSVTLQTANADSLAKNLQAVYAGAAGESKNVKIVADPPTNTIYIAAPGTVREEVLLQIAMAEAQASEFKPQPIQILLGDAESIAETLKAVYKDRSTAKRKITIEGDATSNKLVVSAPKDIYDEIEKLTRDLDQPGSQSMNVKTFVLQHAYAPDVKDKMDKMAQDIIKSAGIGGKKGGKPLDLGAFAVSADPVTNSLVVMGSPSIFAVVEKVLLDIDRQAPPGNQRITKTIVLTKADVSQTAQNINKLYGAKDPRGGVEPPKAEANMAMSAIILEGTQTQIKQIEAEVIRPLEEAVQVEDRPTAVFVLKYADPNSVAQAIQQTFQKRGGTVADRDQVTAVAEGATQSVVVSASKANMQRVSQIIADLDKTSESTRRFHTVKLEHGDASEAARILQQFIDQRKAERGQTKPVVTASPGTNSLMIYASEQELTDFKPLIDVMSQEGAGLRAPQRIVLKYANPSQAADVLTQVFTEHAPGRGGRGSEQRMVPLILADEQSKSLIVRAEAADFEGIKKMAAEMDVEGAEAGPGGVRIISVAKGMDVVDTATKIEKLINDGEKARQSRDKNYKPRNVSIESDLRTNSLIVAGAAGQFEEVELIVRKLAEMKPPGPSAIRMIRFNNIKAPEVQKVLDQLLEKQKKGGGSQGRR